MTESGKRLEPLKLTIQKCSSDFKKSKYSKSANVDHKRKATKKEPFRLSFINGGCGGTRTHDQLIKSQLRYQLRHAPIFYLIFTS